MRLYLVARLSTKLSDHFSDTPHQTETKEHVISVPSMPTPEELNLRKEDAFPVFAKPRGSGKKIYELVPYKDGEMIADYVLFEDSIKAFIFK